MRAGPPPQGLPVTAADVRAGRVAHCHASSAAEHGGVFASEIPPGWPSGPCVVLIGNEALAMATGAARAAFSSAEGWAPLLGKRFGRAVLNADDPQHAVDRRQWAGVFAPAELARCLPALRALVEARAGQWAAAPDFGAHAVSRELAFAAVATTLGGFADDANLPPVLELMGAVLNPAAGGESELDRHLRIAPLRDELEALLRAHLARPRADARAMPSLIDHLRRQDPAPDDDALLAHLNLLLITGHETTASLMAWLLHHAAMPRWRAWLREELDPLEVPAGRAPLAALEALPRLDAFVREAARLYPSLVCAPRIALCDVEIAGVRIPARTRVVLGYGGTNLLASLYDDPAAFAPQRWLATALPRAASFGMGHRLCLGMRFAEMEAKTMLAHVVARYDILRRSDEEPVSAGFWNARPSGGMQLALRPRES